jgi:hypothetical protein
VQSEAQPKTPSRTGDPRSSGARGTRTPDLLGAIQCRVDMSGVEGLTVTRNHGGFGSDVDDDSANAQLLMYPFGTRVCSVGSRRWSMPLPDVLFCLCDPLHPWSLHSRFGAGLGCPAPNRQYPRGRRRRKHEHGLANDRRRRPGSQPDETLDRVPGTRTSLSNQRAELERHPRRPSLGHLRRSLRGHRRPCQAGTPKHRRRWAATRTSPPSPKRSPSRARRWGESSRRHLARGIGTVYGTSDLGSATRSQIRRRKRSRSSVCSVPCST